MIAERFVIPQIDDAPWSAVDLDRFPTVVRMEAACKAVCAFAKAVPKRQSGTGGAKA